jgi:hypothetical protein
MRLALVTQWLRAAREHPEGRSGTLRYTAGVTAVQRSPLQFSQRSQPAARPDPDCSPPLRAGSCWCSRCGGPTSNTPPPAKSGSRCPPTCWATSRSSPGESGTCPPAMPLPTSAGTGLAEALAAVEHLPRCARGFVHGDFCVGSAPPADGRPQRILTHCGSTPSFLFRSSTCPGVSDRGMVLPAAAFPGQRPQDLQAPAVSPSGEGKPARGNAWLARHGRVRLHPSRPGVADGGG